jgi:RepB DNA-primase from phage plasmid
VERLAAVIPQRVALALQLAAMSGNEPATSFLEIRPLERGGGIALSERAFIPVRDTEEIAQRVLGLADTFNVFVAVAPRTRQSGKADAVARCWTLWADLDGPGALERLRAFRPLPSIVIRSGSPDAAHAYWPLRRPVSPEGAQRANRRLAVALDADRAATDPARILRPAGTLNHKHDPPAAVVCTRLELDVFDLSEVVGALPDSDHYAPRPEPRARFQTSDPTNLLAGLARTVAEAQPGNRNAALYWACCRVREHEELDATAAFGDLRTAASHAGLPDVEIERTIASADTRVAA